MGEDEATTVTDLKGHQAVLLPLIGRYDGRIIDTAGDGILAEFGSVIHATECAIEIQAVMARRNEAMPASRRMLFRIGVNLGDVIHDESRIYGDGINVAARLEGIAEPGGICVSRQVFDQLSRALKANFRLLGPRILKNIAKPVDVFAITPADGGRDTDATAPGGGALQQEIRFCTAPDGVQLAYSAIGQGPPLMKTGNWMTHLEFDLESPIWEHLYRELAKDHTLGRYDARGNGLSDRTVDDISFDAFVSDLETVVDAAGITRFALLGISQGCAVSIAYARAARARRRPRPIRCGSPHGGRHPGRPLRPALGTQPPVPRERAGLRPIPGARSRLPRDLADAAAHKSARPVTRTQAGPRSRRLV